ncbi:MAG: COQ9 family protein [Candidatus Puniceispirillaceae bacterium]
MSNSQMSNSQIANDIVRSSLAHVPFDGWTRTSLVMGAADCGISESALDEYLPKGVDDAISLYAAMADADMVSAYEALEKVPDKMHLKIRALILCRLSLALPHKQVVSKTLSYLAQPQQAARATKLLYQTVDVMWRSAGDSATDISFYSKRATLAGVYSATLLAFLADDSADMAKTEAFLDRRLQEVAMIPKVTKPAKAAFGQITGALSAFAGGLIRARRTRG